jgi:hypothetical protein
VKDILVNHVQKGMSYPAYENHVETLYKEAKSTGRTQNDTYLHYSSLGLQRMKRWNKKGVLSPQAIDKLSRLVQPQTWLVISEGWCGDAAHALPFMHKIAESNKFIQLKIVLRDENDELMQYFLTNGGKSIPKLIALDVDYNVLFTWGPRPEVVRQMVEQEKEKNKGNISELFKTDLQKWFNKDKGESVVNEVVALSLK